MIPHTFDLQARAELAVKSLTCLLDPQREGLMYFLAAWRARPPRAVHGMWDCGDGSGRHVDALTLVDRMLPLASSHAQHVNAEGQIEGWMLRLLGPDGLSWLPPEPWAAPWGAEMLLHGGSGSLSPEEILAEVSWSQRGTLLGLTSRFLATGDECYRQAGKNLVDGLVRIVEHHPAGLFFPEGYYRSTGWRFRQPGLFPGLEEVNAAVLVPLVRFHAAADYAPALDLAQGLTSFALEHAQGYHPDGTLRRGELLDHFHTRTNFILGVLELGLVSGNSDFVDWARQRYEHLREWGTDFGWFPEGLGCRHGEICATTDMIEIALQLGRYVNPLYYSHAECYGRNHLLESQFLSLDRLRLAVESLPEERWLDEGLLDYSTTKEVIESQVGGFAARSTLNDAFHLDATAMMQCCNAAGTRALYDLWRYAIEEQETREDELPRRLIHLRFSAETPGLRMVSDEPRSGRLVLTSRCDAVLAVRLPAGETGAILVDREAHRTVSLEATNGYVTFRADAGRTLDLEYPQRERTVDYMAGSQVHPLECTGFWRGETLMQVEPQGSVHPLYSRQSDMPPVQPVLPNYPLIDSLV